jgi:hypothetical protein
VGIVLINCNKEKISIKRYNRTDVHYFGLSCAVKGFVGSFFWGVGGRVEARGESNSRDEASVMFVYGY